MPLPFSFPLDLPYLGVPLSAEDRIYRADTAETIQLPISRETGEKLRVAAMDAPWVVVVRARAGFPSYPVSLFAFNVESREIVEIDTYERGGAEVHLDGARVLLYFTCLADRGCDPPEERRIDVFDLGDRSLRTVLSDMRLRGDLRTSGGWFVNTRCFVGTAQYCDRDIIAYDLASDQLVNITNDATDDYLPIVAGSAVIYFTDHFVPEPDSTLSCFAVFWSLAALGSRSKSPRHTDPVSSSRSCRSPTDTPH